MAKVKLSSVSTTAPEKLSKEKLKAETASMLQELDELQNLLIAQARYSLLVVIQGMDASGKDGVLRNVFGSLNPLGVSVTSFKVPTAEELSHDFLWRVHKMVPPKGMIRIFNRSHYEDILVTRVHGWCDDATARKRIKAINDFEQLLTEHNNTIILKFYLHVSREEQHRRLTERTRDPRKMWKYNENDFKEAGLWKQYMNYYEECFEQCNKIPWHIIPSDQNWYKEYLITKELVRTLKRLKMQYPGLKK